MKKQSRRKFAPEFKAKVALEDLKNQFTLAELGAKYQLSPVVISKWKSELLENMSSVFDKGSKRQEDNSADMEQLYSQICKLKVENDVLKKSYEKLGI
jgi:transposase-like protein